MAATILLENGRGSIGLESGDGVILLEGAALTMPDFIDYPGVLNSIAITTLATLGITLYSDLPVPSSSVAPGYIVSQSPPPGVAILGSEIVTLTYSIGAYNPLNFALLGIKMTIATGKIEVRFNPNQAFPP